MHPISAPYALKRLSGLIYLPMARCAVDQLIVTQYINQHGMNSINLLRSVCTLPSTLFRAERKPYRASAMLACAVCSGAVSNVKMDGVAARSARTVQLHPTRRPPKTLGCHARGFRRTCGTVEGQPCSRSSRQLGSASARARPRLAQACTTTVAMSLYARAQHTAAL